MKTFPSFLWILRDFALRLEDRNGNEIQKDKINNKMKLTKIKKNYIDI